MSKFSSQSRRSGFSLIEVAIALAIFVFGALAIVQIFPPALGVIRNNESRVTATQLGESTLALMSNKNSQPPEAIFDADASGIWQDFPAAVVGTVSKNNSLPVSSIASDFGRSALAHFRFIYGEPHYVGVGQTVMLNYPHDDTVANLSFFTEEMIEGVQLSADGYLDFSNATVSNTGAAFNDPANPSRSPDTNRGNDFTYYISYRWRESIPPGPSTYSDINGVIDEPLVIPTNGGGFSATTSARVFACSFNTSNLAIPGILKIRVRRSVTLGSSTTLGSGPRKIVSLQNSGASPVKIYCNYLASDWRNIVSEGIPNNNIVKLPINGIDTNSVFGVLTNSNFTSGPTLLNAPTQITAIDSKKGAVTYSIPATPGARIRTVYQGIDGWAHQPSVAASSYIPYDANRGAGNFPREQWREYAWTPGGRMIYFHASEAGKSISISYQDTSGKIVNGAILTIRNTEQVTTLPSGFFGAANAGQLVAPVEITDLSGDPVDASAILSVQGLSVQARTAWQNGDRYTQVIVPGYRALMP